MAKNNNIDIVDGDRDGHADKLPKSLMTEASRHLFPLRTIDSVVAFFKHEVQQRQEPNLALLSIILGAIEHSLTNVPMNSNDVTVGKSSAPPKGKWSKAGRRIRQRQPTSVVSTKPKEVTEGASNEGHGENHTDTTDDSKSLQPLEETDFPPLTIDTVESLYEQFHTMILSKLDLSLYREDLKLLEVNGITASSPKDLLKIISDTVWLHLTRSYKGDSPHLQTLYTYLTGKKLDSFGVSLAVVAGCQIAGLRDVHLALSEDHSWIVYGPHGKYNAEVTWHGKGNEDRRGQETGLGDDAYSWLYQQGQAVICDRHMEVAALVRAINPSISATADSLEMGLIQQHLLWELYDAGHLKRYPMALDTLADLEEITPTRGRKSCDTLFREAITASTTFYKNMHVFPHTHYGAYLYRQEEYKTAVMSWADAAGVIKNYRYSRNDEEIYKEFLEISTDHIPHIMKTSSTGISATSLTRDPGSFAELLRFFDGICLWEQSSKIPVIHIVWAKAWVTALSKFEDSIRRRVQIFAEVEEETKENSKQVDVREESKDSGIDDSDLPMVMARLHSHKMKALKDLLQGKFNPGALSLHLTAQTSTAPTGNGTPDGSSRTRSCNSKQQTSTKESKASVEPPRKKVKQETQ